MAVAIADRVSRKGTKGSRADMRYLLLDVVMAVIRKVEVQMPVASPSDKSLLQVARS